MGELKIERRGGLAAFGGANLKSEARLDMATLAAADRAAIDALFADPAAVPRDAVADGFTYRMTRTEGGRKHSIDVPESRVPATVADSVKDAFR